MEEQVTFAVEALTLEGLFFMPETPSSIGVVLCHPHPLYGGEMRNNIVSALARSLQKAGITTLRFNFRGVGQSTGTHGSGKTEVDDVQAAVTYLLSRQEVSTVIVAGYSFGAMIGLRAGASDARVHKLIGVALPVARTDADFLITANKPTLLISGDRDTISPITSLEALVDKLPAPKKLITVNGADHFFIGREGEVAQAALAFAQSP